MSKADERDTLPAMPPGAPDWAQALYDMMLYTYQVQTKKERAQDAKILELQAAVFGTEHSNSGYPDEDTDPGPRN